MTILAIPLVMLLAMLLLGGLAAVVFALVYAIANKRPGVALAAVLAPVGAVVAVGVLAALFVGTARFTAHSSAPTSVEWKGMPPMPPMPAMPPMPSMTTVNVGSRATWVMMLSIVLFVVAILVFRKRSCQTGERRGGWGKAIVIGLLLFVAANYFIIRSSYRTTSVAHGGHNQIQAQHEWEEQIRRDAKHAQQQAIEVQRQTEAAQEAAAGHRSIEFKSMQELWEKLNQSRIKLESDEHGASMKVGAEPNQVEMVAEVDGNADVIVPISAKSPEALDRSLARLERMVEKVSAMADQVSDAGTLVGKAMIALNETMDSRHEPALPPLPVAATQIVSPTPHVEEAQADAEKVIQESFSSLKLVSKSHDENEVDVANRRPDWIDDPPKRVGNAWREVLVTDEYATPDECDRAMDVYLLLKTHEHLEQLLGMPRSEFSLPSLSFNVKERGTISADGEVIFERSGKSGVWRDERIQLLNQMGIGIDQIRREIVSEDREYYETVDRSFGKMHKLYAQVEFTPSVDSELRQRWDEYRRQERFAVVGAGAGSVLGLIGLAFGLLKVDTWTKGYYTKRLFLGVPAAIIGLIGLLSMVAE